MDFDKDEFDTGTPRDLAGLHASSWAGPSQIPQEIGQQTVEVSVDRIRHTFKKDELRFLIGSKTKYCRQRMTG
jgi:hypothetical protein